MMHHEENEREGSEENDEHLYSDSESPQGNEKIEECNIGVKRREGVGNIKLDVNIVAGEITIDEKRVEVMAEGDVFELDWCDTSRLKMYVGGSDIGSVRIVKVNDRMGVQIVELRR